MPLGTIRFSFFLKTFFLLTLVAAFAIEPHLRAVASCKGAWPCAPAILCLCGRPLLIGDRTFAWSLTSPRIGMGPLPPHGEAAPVPESPIGPDFDQPPNAQ